MFLNVFHDVSIHSVLLEGPFCCLSLIRSGSRRLSQKKKVGVDVQKNCEMKDGD